MREEAGTTPGSLRSRDGFLLATESICFERRVHILPARFVRLCKQLATEILAKENEGKREDVWRSSAHVRPSGQP